VATHHLGLILPNYGDALEAERLAGVAIAAEEAGFDSGWVTDHVIVPPEHAPIYGRIAEALVSLGFLAGRTHRLQIGVSALVVPQRNAIVALKQLATIDFLSGGRLVTAVTPGWMEGEFRLLGADFEHRGRVLNEWLELARREEIELWIAGVSQATLRRAAKTGVWHPVALPPDELRPMAEELRERRPDSRVILRIGVYLQNKLTPGTDERGRHAIAGPPEWIAERLAEYLEAGCNGFVVNLDHLAPDLEDRVHRFAADVWPLIALQ
jgi:alkanesulfonate monooxygenase SsuD/methylene tetrahydromethanopterin reductase-like flavin-dependent oxidoreductase (luciferase family)